MHVYVNVNVIIMQVKKKKTRKLLSPRNVQAFNRLVPLVCITLAKKIETAMHAKLQARACSREHAPVLQCARLSQFFLARSTCVHGRGRD